MKCQHCDIEFTSVHWSMVYCSPKCRRKHGSHKMELWRARDKATNPEKWIRKQRAAGLKHNYNMTIEDYEAMACRQGGLCPICNEPLPVIEKENGKHPPVDHDHTTGSPRGILHNKCNRALGLLNDNSVLCRRAADYLERHGK